MDILIKYCKNKVFTKKHNLAEIKQGKRSQAKNKQRSVVAITLSKYFL